MTFNLVNAIDFMTSDRMITRSVWLLSNSCFYKKKHLFPPSMTHYVIDRLVE